MGCVNSHSNPEADARSRAIDDSIRANKQELQHQVKLLLLGAGESGKSTILKQLKVIHQEGYTDQEKLGFRDIIFGNVGFGMQAIAEGIQRKEVKLSSPENDALIPRILELTDMAEGMNLEGEILTIILQLWADPLCKRAYQERAQNLIHIGDGVGYYLDNIERIADPEYVPTEHDILMSRVKTTGVVERSFSYKKMDFRIFDVGGQRSERKKWIHCFEDVTCLIFCVASSAYDEKLIEDEKINRLEESLGLFDSVCNNQFFENTSIILFLNKMDLFKEKVMKVPIKDTFPDYTGKEQDWEDGIAFIESKYKALNNNTENKTIYVKLTCATDTDNVRFMFDAVTDVIIAEHLKRHALI